MLLFQIAAGSRASLLDLQRRIATILQERTETVISPRSVTLATDKEELWARVSVKQVLDGSLSDYVTVCVVKIETSARSVSDRRLGCEVNSKHGSFM